MSQIVQTTVLYSGTFFSFMLIGIFLENTILTRALGVDTVLQIVKCKADYSLFCILLTCITTLSSILAFWINPLLEELSFAYYIRPLVYVVILCILYLITLFIISFFSDNTKTQLRPMVHLSVFNTAVFGALLLASALPMNFTTAVGFGFGSGVGFFLATFLIAEAGSYLCSQAIPRPFRGFPVTIIFVGMVSLSLYGIIGNPLSFSF